MALLCGKKKPLTTSIVDMDDSGHGDECSEFDGVENQGLLETRPAMEHLTLLMNRAKKGFGFTVTGGNPVRVGRVEEGSPALQAGLKSDDCIIRINGQNVVKVDVDRVAKIVKQCDKQVVMDVHRYHRNNTYSQGVSTDRRYLDFDDSMSESSYCSSGIGTESVHQRGQSNSNNRGTIPGWIPVENMPKISPWQLYHQLKDQQLNADNHQMFDDCDSEYSYYTETESCYSCYTCVTDESDDSQRSHSRSPPNKLCKLSSQGSSDEEQQPQSSRISAKQNHITATTSMTNPAFDKENLGPKLAPKSFGRRPVSAVSSTSSTSTDRVPPPKPVRSSSCGGSSSNSSVSDKSEGSSPVSVSSVARLAVRYHELSEEELSRQKCLHQLYQCEVQYHRELKRGIQVYCRTLRQNVVTPQQHAILFQNIEKLCALSEKIILSIKQVQVSYSDVMSPNEQYIDHMGTIYTSMLEDFCESYELYCSGVCDSVKLLSELRSYKDFCKYVKKLGNDENKTNDILSLGKFIQRPVEHMKNLTLQMQKINKNTPAAHQDSDELQDMINALRRTSGNITQEYVRRSRSNLSSITTSSSQYSYATSSGSRSSVSTSSDKESTANSSTSSVDLEVQDIQNRLLFGENTKSFQLTSTARHVIYAGDLMRKTSDNWTKVHAILMNDLLLLTRKECDNFLTVLEAPILLQDVRRCESGTIHPSEISLTVDCHHWQTLGYEPRLFTLRATTLEQKCVWKNLIDQKMAASKAQKELTVSKVAEFM